MNAKKAKALRRLARNNTVGMPHVEYQPLAPSMVGLPPQQAKFLGQVTMVATCTRAVYQQMKRAH